METMSASNLSEYTLNSTGTSAASMGVRNAPQNTVLEDAALSQEHMESMLTIGRDSLHD